MGIRGPSQVPVPRPSVEELKTVLVEERDALLAPRQTGARRKWAFGLAAIVLAAVVLLLLFVLL
jgi:hypothetical protein